MNTRGQDYSNNISPNLQIPLEFIVKLPPPLRTGIDYGFLPGTNKTRKLSNV